MTSTRLMRTTAVAGGALLITGLAAAPALAADYPPKDQSDTTVDTGTDPATVTSDGQTPAYTGAATTLGLAAGVVVLGAGAGLLIASRRRSN